MAFGNTSFEKKPSKFSLSSFVGMAMENGSGITKIPISDLHPYKDGNQPFSMYSEEKMLNLVESISTNGLLQPVLVRRIVDEKSNDKAFEILAGHNRVEACRRLNMESIKCIIFEGLSDDQAALIVTDTNLYQRDTIPPSERAAAYAMQKQALESMGIKSYTATMAEQYGESSKTVSRYIALNRLNRELLKAVDEGRVTVNAGAIISGLAPDDQKVVAEYLEKNSDLKVKEQDAAKIMRNVKIGDKSDTAPANAPKQKSFISIKLQTKLVEEVSQLPQENLSDFFLFCLQREDFQKQFLAMLGGNDNA